MYGQMRQARLRLRTRPQGRHGPYHSLTHAVEGKPRPHLRPEEALVVRQQIAAGRKLRAQVDAYREVREEWLMVN